MSEQINEVFSTNELGASRIYPKQNIANFGIEPKLSGNYDIISFGNNIVKRSMNVFTDQDHNNLHMIAGLTSELTEEFISSFTNLNEDGNSDVTNMAEELGDGLWFTVGLLIHNGFWKEENFQKIASTDSMVLNMGFDWTDETMAEKLKDDGSFHSLFNAVFFQTLKQIGRINTIYKNILIKNTAKLNGKVLSDGEILDEILRLIICINTLSIFTGKSIYEIREMNDKKLFKRYDGGTFTAEKSLNRDTNSEREILESV